MGSMGILKAWRRSSHLGTGASLVRTGTTIDDADAKHRAHAAKGRMLTSKRQRRLEDSRVRGRAGVGRRWLGGG